MPDDPSIHDLAANLVMSEPFMQIGTTIAHAGSKVQDAWDTVTSHLSDLASKAKPAAQAAVNAVSQAVTPTVQAQEAAPATEAAPSKPMSSSEFAQSIKAKYPAYKDVPDDVLTAKMLEKYPVYRDKVTVQPMNAAKVNGQDVPIEDWRQAVGKGQVIFSNKVVSGAVDNAPMIGGTIGGILGGIPGAAAGGAAGSLIKQGVQAASGTTTEPVTAAQAAGNVVGAAATQGALEGAGSLIPAALSSAAKGVYRSYLKPSLAMKAAPKAEAIVQTALDEALPISHTGAAKAQRLIGQINGQVKSILANSPGDVDLHEVADKVRIWATKNFYKSGVMAGDYDAALKVADSIDKHAALEISKKVPVTKIVDSAIVDEAGNPFRHEITTNRNVIDYRKSVPVLEAQYSKQGLQNAARNAYGVQSAATTTAQKVGASELRQAIEAQAPAVAGLNARESKLIDTAKAINRAVGREANQYKMHGTKALVGAAFGSEEYTRTGDPWSAAVKGLAVTLALQPAVASRAAIVASRLGRLSGVAPTVAARLAIMAAQQAGGSDPSEPTTPTTPTQYRVGPYVVQEHQP